MTALAAAANRPKRGEGKIVRGLVGDAEIIYKGAICALDATGFVIPATDTAGLQVIGVADETVDNSAGADGAKEVRIICDATFKFTASSITQAMVGDLMVVVDDNTVDDVAAPVNDISVGRLVEFVSSTEGWVYVPGLTSL